MKKLVALFLALVMTLSLASFAAAEEPFEITVMLPEFVVDVDFAAEKKLISDGILDSLDILTLVDEINAAFDVDVKPKYLTAENFNSVESMWQLIAQLQAEG